MKTSCFDAVVNFSPVEREKSLDASLLIQGEKISSSRVAGLNGSDPKKRSNSRNLVNYLLFLCFA